MNADIPQLKPGSVAAEAQLRLVMTTSSLSQAANFP
jgi:hypothetical protein